MAWLIVGSGAVGVLQAAFGYLWKVVMDSAVTGDATSAGTAMVAVGLMQSALYVFVQGTRTWMNAHIQRTARDAVYAGVLRGRLDGYRTGDLVTRLTDDLSDEKLSWFLCSGVFRAVEATVVVLCCTATMFWISPTLTLWCLLPLPLLAVVHRTIGGRVTRTAAAVQDAISTLGTLVHDAFTGVRVIQSSALEPLAERAFGALALAQADAEVANTRMQQLFFAQFVYGWQLALAVLLVVGGLGIREGTVGVSDFAALSGFLMTMVFQMFDFGAFAVRGRQAAASLGRLQELMDLEPVPRPPASDTVVLDSLVRPFLRVDFDEPVRIAAGQLIAVTGAVGSGKSTLLRAIAERMDIEAPDAAWVPQEPVLFSVSLEANVRLGEAGRDLGPSIEAARLQADLSRMPDGLATRVGERGVMLSGGQQQRLQLARALYSARGLLVLDDATSALDAETEQQFWQGLKAHAAEQTIVAVTHRVATLARADRVVWLRRVGDRSTARTGTHAELLADPGYATLYG